MKPGQYGSLYNGGPFTYAIITGLSLSVRRRDIQYAIDVPASSEEK